ncbi:phosphoglucosamine mutase, partial [Candidatus Bathyarchaeota archaeon]|nr:phosphoglucosamine mutase [Candidatus Bathyarchaeota archaeon]
SHNPPQYNGIKIFNHEGLSYNDEAQTEIESIIRQKNFELADWHDIREVSRLNGETPYLGMVLDKVKLRKNWIIVLDSGCGATYNLAPTMLKTLGCKVMTLNAHPDGYFPARNSEPTLESLKSLAQTVKEVGAQIGIAYDGDGDRVAFIDADGSFVDFDRALASYSAHIVKKNGGGTVVTNVEASMCVERMVEAQGGKVVRTKVGDIYVSDEVKHKNAVFGGEPCGAWIHPKFHLCPDGLLSSALLLKALEDQNKCLGEFIAEVPQYVILRENIYCKPNLKHKIFKRTRKTIERSFMGFTEISEIDGVRLSFRDGWLLIRASGTEPIIRVTVEGESLKAAKEIMKKGITFVQEQVEELET